MKTASTMQWLFIQITTTKVWIMQIYDIILYSFHNIETIAISVVSMGKVLPSKYGHEVDTCLLVWSMRKKTCDFEGGKRMYIE